MMDETLPHILYLLLFLIYAYLSHGFDFYYSSLNNDKKNILNMSLSVDI